MSQALQRHMTLAEFLEWEDGQETKWEFDGFEPVAMAGGSLAHARIQRNLAISVGSRLRGTKCEFIGSDLKIEVVGRIRYPDGFVLCSTFPRDTKVVTGAVVVFEILSPSTAKIDFRDKNGEYEATPSIRRYVILDQDQIGGTMWERQGSEWVGHVIKDGATLHMPEIGITVPLAELYEGVDLAPNLPHPLALPPETEPSHAAHP